VNSFQQAETSRNQVESLLHLIEIPTYDTLRGGGLIPKRIIGINQNIDGKVKKIAWHNRALYLFCVQSF